MAKSARTTLQISNNEDAVVRFTFGNCSRLKSKKGGGYYYTFVVSVVDEAGEEMEDYQINANEELVQEVAANWPGRGGLAKITRLNSTNWSVEVVEEAETSQYPLEIREWDNLTKSFRTVGEAGAGEDEDEKPKPKPPPTAADRPPYPSMDYMDMGTILQYCCEDTKAIVMAMTDGMGPEQIEAWQKIAVSLFIDVRRAGLSVDAITKSREKGLPDPEDIDFT